MKLFKWRIFSLAKAEKIATLIGEVPEDREIAKEFLLGANNKPDKRYPRYRIKVSEGYIRRQVKYSPLKGWITSDSDTFDTAADKSAYIKKHTAIIERKLQENTVKYSEKYTINF